MSAKGRKSPGQGALAGSDVVAFVGTASPAKAKAFYGATLGLPLVSEDPFAIVFDANGTMLRLAIVEKVAAAPYTVLGWAVDDIASRVRELSRAGVAFQRYPGMPQDELGIWSAPSGAKVAWFRDPDGNTLSLSEP